MKDKYWINAMQDELGQFAGNNVWILIPKPNDKKIIGTKGYSKLKLTRITLLLGIRVDWQSKLYTSRRC